jgi:serine/threonine protein kinase
VLKAQTNASSRPAQDGFGEQPRQSSSPGHNPSPESATIKSSKKRHRSPEPMASNEIHTAQAYETNAPRDFKLRMGSPWDWYREVLDLDLNGPVTVAERKAPQYGLVAIKVFPSTAAEKALERHQRVKHENIVALLDAFTTDTSLYIVLEHSPISLEQIVGGAKYPTEWQLAAILKQVRYVPRQRSTLADTEHSRSSAP